MHDAAEHTTQLTVWRVRNAGAFGLLLVAFGCGTDNVGSSGSMTSSLGGTGGTSSVAMGGAQGKSGGTKGMTGGKANSSSGGASANGAGGKASNAGGKTSSGGTGMGGEPSALGSATGSGGEATETGGAQGNSVGTRSAGCGKTGTPMSRYIDATIDGQARKYYLSFPANYDPNKAYALVFAFHGYGGTGDNFRQWAGVEENSNSEAIFAYLDGLDGIWDLENNGNDFKLVDAIYASVRANYCIDETDVFAFGFSYGGWTATQVSCARPALIHGIVSIAGGGPTGTCNQPVAAMIVHGEADSTMNGGEDFAQGLATRDRYKKANACSDASSPAMPNPCVSYAGCSQPVYWCAHPGAHQIPDFAKQGTWAFFAGLR